MFAVKRWNYGNGQLTKQAKEASLPIMLSANYHFEGKKIYIKYDFLNSSYHPRLKSKNKLDFETDFFPEQDFG